MPCLSAKLQDQFKEDRLKRWYERLVGDSDAVYDTKCILTNIQKNESYV